MCIVSYLANYLEPFIDIGALLEKEAIMDIGAGENKGTKLTHTNVVRTFLHRTAEKDNVLLAGLPEGADSMTIGDWFFLRKIDGAGVDHRRRCIRPVK